MTEPRTCRTRAPVPILAYHEVGRPWPRGTPLRHLVLSPRRFERQLRTLARLGFRGLSLQDLRPYLLGERTGRVVGLTLDDGYAGICQHALPLLCRYGFTATVFVVSGHVGGCNAWDRGLGVPPLRLMDRVQLRAWLDAGMEVGAHTCAHPDLLACDAARAWSEILGSRLALEQALGVAVRSFCYPYGRCRPEHLELVLRAGFEQAAGCESRRVRAGADLLCLPRITVRADRPLAVWLAQVACGLEDWRRDAAAWARGWRAQWPQLLRGRRPAERPLG